MTLNAAGLMAVFVFTALAGVVTTRFSIWLSYRLGIYDEPNDRKRHGRRVAYLGGLGMLLAFLAGLGGLAAFSPEFSLLHPDIFHVILLGAVAIFAVGFWDDVRPLGAFLKLGLQLAVAAFMWWAGVRVESLSLGTQSGHAVGSVISLIITLGWYVVLMNSINLVDGLDGLAGGITFISAASLVGVSVAINPSFEVVVGGYLSAMTAGATLGFLVFNWHPAKTFMGDGGSLLLGYLLATASLIGSTKTPTLLAVAVPIVALGLPLFETFFSFLRRALAGQHPFKPDRRHLHHRLLDVGLDQRRVVVVLLFLTAFLGLNAIIMVMAESRLLLVNVMLLIAGMIILIENLKYLEQRRTQSSAAVPAPPVVRSDSG